MSHQDVDTCINNQELQKSILDRLRAAQVQFEINSTPSFVINNTTTITGSLNYEAFNASLESATNPAEPEAPDETAETEAEGVAYWGQTEQEPAKREQRGEENYGGYRGEKRGQPQGRGFLHAERGLLETNL